jgi:hypothetical protein
MSTTLSVFGRLSTLAIAPIVGSAYAGAAAAQTTPASTIAGTAGRAATGKVIVVGMTAKDATGEVIQLSTAKAANSVTTANWTVDSDKIADVQAARTAGTLGASVTEVAEEAAELSATAGYGANAAYITCGTKPEKLTITAWGKNSAEAWVSSNTISVFCAGDAAKVTVTATATTANVDVVDANGYPVSDRTSVTLAASNGTVVAPSTKTTTAGKFTTPATVIPSTTSGSGSVTAIVGSVTGSAVITGTGTSELASITTLVNSLIAKINALNKLVIKIQKKVRA